MTVALRGRALEGDGAHARPLTEAPVPRAQPRREPEGRVVFARPTPHRGRRDAACRHGLTTAEMAPRRIGRGSREWAALRRASGSDVAPLVGRRRGLQRCLFVVPGMVWLAIALVPAVAVDPARAAACGHAGGATPWEAADVCRALSDVLGYFRAMGFQLEPAGSVTFLRRGDPATSGTTHVHGYFDRRQSAVVLFREPGTEPWGLTWSDEVAASFARHELVHIALWQTLRDAPTRLRREWHQFIAYAVQIALMSPRLRDQVLAQ